MDIPWGIIKSCLSGPRDFFFFSWVKGKKRFVDISKMPLTHEKKKTNISGYAKTASYYTPRNVHTKFQGLTRKIDERIRLQTSKPLLGWPSSYLGNALRARHPEVKGENMKKNNGVKWASSWFTSVQAAYELSDECNRATSRTSLRPLKSRYSGVRRCHVCYLSFTILQFSRPDLQNQREREREHCLLCNGFQHICCTFQITTQNWEYQEQNSE